MTIRKPHVYLAGPTVFSPNSAEIFRQLKELCEKHGMVGCSPLDTELDFSECTPQQAAEMIYQANVSLIKNCDAVLADVSAFRGVEPDSGTCFEIGMAVALGKPAAIYSKNSAKTMATRVEEAMATSKVEGVLLDKDGIVVEDFGLPYNLMLAASCKVFEEPEAALQDLAKTCQRQRVGESYVLRSSHNPNLYLAHISDSGAVALGAITSAKCFSYLWEASIVQLELGLETATAQLEIVPYATAMAEAQLAS